MNFRKANINDLDKLNFLYQEIINSMVVNGIDIWQIFNPCKFFEQDILNNRLYVLEKKQEIIGSFAILEETKGARYIDWSKNEKSVYLSRLGVSPKLAGQKIGTILIEHAIEIAKKRNNSALRLLVVDTNIPAIKFYSKNGFNQASGIYYDEVNETTTFNEFGYERYF